MKRQAEHLRDEQIAELAQADASRILTDDERAAYRQLVTLRNSGEVDALLMPEWAERGGLNPGRQGIPNGTESEV